MKIPFASLEPRPLPLDGYRSDRIMGVVWICPLCRDQIPFHVDWRVDVGVPQGYEDSHLNLDAGRGRIEGLRLERDGETGELRLDWSGVSLMPPTPGGASSVQTRHACGAHYWIRDGFAVFDAPSD